MLRHAPSSWTISWDAPLWSNFALYAAAACGFEDAGGLFAARSAWPLPFLASLLEDAEREESALAWRTWWNEVVEDTCRYLAGGSRDDATSLLFPEAADRPGLSACPALQRACRLAWPHFRAWWGHPALGKAALTARITTALSLESGAVVQRAVRDAERRLRRRVRPFRIHVGVVYVDGSQPVDAGEDCALVPVGLLTRPDALRDWLAGRIARMA